jgi:hypothetical protein
VTLPLARPAPPVLECRFEPVSRREERQQSGFEMCFSPSSPEPWWAQASGVPADGGAGELAKADAGSKLEPRPCPDDMLLIEGEYCPRVRHRCLRWLDEPGGAFKGKHRCAEFERDPNAPRRQHRRFASIETVRGAGRRALVGSRGPSGDVRTRQATLLQSGGSLPVKAALSPTPTAFRATPSAAITTRKT